MFYVKWNEGELTLEDLQVYVKEYYHLARHIPNMCSSIRDNAKTKRPDMIDAITQNMEEEAEHADLWLTFGTSLGLTKNEITAYEPSETMKTAVSDLCTLCDKSFEEGVAAMYALECELPEVAETKKAGLKKFYNLESHDAHVYFDEHLNEAKHLQVWIKTDVNDKTEQAIHDSMSAQNRVLDAVCEVAGISY